MFFQNILPLHGLHGSNKLHRHIQIISLDGVDSRPTLIMNTSFGPLSKELGEEKLISLLRFSHIHGEMGSGISRITEACTKAGLPIPTWTSDGYSVTVTFKRPNTESNTEQVDDKHSKATQQATQQVINLLKVLNKIWYCQAWAFRPYDIQQ